jgi:hypothetical protein
MGSTHRYDRVRTLAHKHKGLLTLIDSNNKLSTLPNGLVSLPVRIVQATSPLEDRFNEWSKQRENSVVWILDPWLDDELRQGTRA